MRAFPVLRAAVPTTGALAFGASRSPTHVHRGVDFPRASGEPVSAAADGVVEHASAEWEQGFSGYGGHVVVRHAQAWTLYAHLQSVSVPVGRRVLAGDELGKVGRTAYTVEDRSALLGGSHLHFEVSPRKYPQSSESARLDPATWLREAVDARVATAIATAARGSSVDLSLMRAVAYAASRWNPAARAGERVGLFGLPEQSARVLGVSNPLDPLENARAAATLLRSLLLRFTALPTVLAAYAWGSTQVEHSKNANDWPSSVTHFVSSALERYQLEQREAAVQLNRPLVLEPGSGPNVGPR